MPESLEFPNPFGDSDTAGAKPAGEPQTTPEFTPDDIEALDLGSEDDAPNPFDIPEDTPADDKTAFGDTFGETPAKAAPQSPNRAAFRSEPAEDAEPTDSSDKNTDAQTASAGVSCKQEEIAQTPPVSVYAKPPVFSHASASEPIEDTAQTFDDLRTAKSEDFPELEDANRVSWEVTYGKIKKYVSTGDAKKKKIGELKSEIEASKEFAKDLKTSKDKNPTCFVKPRITAQSKGRIAAYKGVFTNLDTARASGRAICLVPGRDGSVYEIRKTETGEYITPASGCAELSEIRAGFLPALPRVPGSVLLEITDFFRTIMEKNGGSEAIANIYWDKKCREYFICIPKQRVTRTSAESDLTNAPDSERCLHYADVHSHNTMPARFSARDDADEKATRVYIVLGRLDEDRPEIGIRVSSGGKHIPVDYALIFDGCGELFRAVPAHGGRETKNPVRRSPAKGGGA
jgi:hypothetical protein